MAATEQVMILLRAKDEASHIIDGVGGKLNGLAGIAQSAVMAAGAAAVAAVAGITTAIGVGVGKAMDMEQQIADIASVMNITAQEAAPLKELISQLGVDPNLKVSANEAADAIQMLARNGLSMTDILDGAAHSTVLLANATNADFAVAADIATDVMALFNIDAKNMAEAVNGITSVTTSSKFAIDDYRLALAQGGGVAAAAGVDFADFNTTIAAISPYFASGSDAGTSFKVMIQRLIPTSKDAEAAMKELGLMTAEGANQFFNADGSMKSMAEIAGLLQGALGNLTEEQKNAALSTIFGTDAMRAAVGLAEVGEDKFNELADSMAAIDAESMAATRMDTLSGALEILQGIIDGVLMQIGDEFLPVLRRFTQWGIELADTYGPAVVNWFGQLANVIPPLTNYIQAIAEDGDTLNDWLTHLPPAIQPVIAYFGQILAVLRSLFLWISTGDPGRILQDFQRLWNTTATIIQNAVNTAINYVREKWPEWVAVLMSWGELFGSWALNLWSTQIQPGIASSLTTLFGYVREKWPEWVAVLMSWGELFGSWAANLWNTYILPGLADMWGNLKGWLDEKAGGLGTNLEEWTRNFLKVTSDIIGGWGEAWPDIIKIVADSAGEIGESVSNILASLNKIGSWFSAGGEGSNVKWSWGDFWKTLVMSVAVAMEGMVTGVEIVIQAFTALGEAIVAIGTLDLDRLGGAAGLAAGIGQIMSDFMVQMTQRINDAFPGRAAGGPVDAGKPYFVGEQGMELFVPDSNGTIIPHNQVSSTVNNNYNLSVVGNGDSGGDAMAALRLASALYGA